MRRTRFVRHVRLGIKSLLLHKLRSALTMLGVVFGVGSVVAMLAVGEGASRQAVEQITKLGARNIIINAQEPDQQQSRSTQRSRTNAYGLTYRDLRRVEDNYPHVRRAVPAKIVSRDARLGPRSDRGRVVGTSADWFQLVQRPVIAGRVLRESDIENNEGVCVITEEVARDLLAGRSPLDSTISVGKDAYRVVGVIQSDESRGGGVQTPDRANDIYIPISTARERIGDTVTERGSGSFSRERVELHQIIAEVDSREHVEATATAIGRMLENNHSQKDYVVAVPLALLEQARQTQRIFSIVLASIAGISLLVGGIGIMNIMLASVTERTREIGVRRAIGARQSQIVGQFLIETTVLSVVGGLIGVGLGVVIPQIIERFADMPTAVTLWSILVSLGISAGVGIIFGLYPAYRAAGLDPIVALRHE